MQRLHLVLPLLCGLMCSGCFQMSAVLKVNGDGSGTLVARTIVLSSANDRLRHFTAAFGQDTPVGTGFAPAPAESARRIAGQLGVTFVASAPIPRADGTGIETTFAFADINKVDIVILLSALIESDGPFSAGSSPLPIEFRRNPSGSATLRAQVSIFEPGNTVSLPPLQRSNQALEQQAESAFVLDLLRGAHLEFAIEPNGTIVRTNSPYVEHGRVTLFELDPEKLVSDELEMKMAGARTEEEKRAVLADAGGMKIATSPEVTIEFTPF